MMPLVYRVWQHAQRDWRFEVRYDGTSSNATTGSRTNRKDARAAALSCIAAAHRRDAATWVTVETP